MIKGTLIADTQNNIAVIYNKRTRINRDTVDFIQEQFKRYKTINYNVSGFSIKKAHTVNTADYKAVLLLNTDVKNGIDKSIADYISSCNDKPKLILITLLKDNKELMIKTFKPSPATLGIDAVTGPSVWKDRGLSAYFGGKNPEEYDIHIEWLKHVLVLLSEMDG
ncbi:MAG: hypothetical protein JW864_09305 [Spirochaetes bacterium]|nr:hypothetical protein [Spirochaetota bacterium]